MTPEELLAGIRDGNFHYGGIPCLRVLRLASELAEGLAREVDRLCATESGSDVQERNHITHWTRPHGAVLQYSLLNRSGDFADFTDDHDLSCLSKHFHHGVRYPHLSTFIDGLVHAINFRINLLGPDASLSPHEEHSLFMSHTGVVAVRARFHLPIRTSDEASMTIEGRTYRFAPNTVYYFNQGCVHSARNGGPQPRVHLVWDQLLTAEVFALMFGTVALPHGWQRCFAAERPVHAMSEAVVEEYGRIPPMVTPAEAVHLSLSPIQ